MDGSSLTLRQRLTLALLAVLQNSLVGGLVYGWASIDRSLLVKDANLTFNETTAIFSWACSVGMFSSLLMGPILDHYGPRKCSVVGHLIVGIGCQCFALANSYGGFLVGTILITFGGPGIQLSIVHLCSLFPKNQYFALCSINGSISFSFIVFVAFAAIWEATEVSFRTLFQVQALIIFASMLVSWMVWPDKPYKLPPATDNHEMTLEDQLVEALTAHGRLFSEQSLDSFLREGDKQLQRHHSFIESKNALARGEDLLVDLKDMPFWKQLGSGTYLRAVFTFLTSCFLANFYVASISTELADFEEFTTVEQHELTQTFTLIMSGGVVASLLVGWLMDQVGLEVCTAVTLALGQIQVIVLVWLANQRFYLVVSFVCYTLFRSFLFPVFIASLTTNLGYKYFGLLNGIGFALSGVAQAFMGRLAQAVQGDCHWNTNVTDQSITPPCDQGHWLALHMVELGVLTLLLAAPLMEYIERKQRKQRLRNALGSIRSFSSAYYGSISSMQETRSDDSDEMVGLTV